MTVATDLKGIVVPIMTPLTAEERVDEIGLRRLINHILSGGVHGIFVMGTSGEFARLGLSEWETAIGVTVDEVSRRVPVYVGIADAGANLVKNKAYLAHAMHADVLVATPPYYFPVTQEEVYLFYKEVAAEIALPLVLYNIPSTTGVSIDLSTLIRLSDVDGIFGVKDSSGDLEALRNTLAHFNRNEDFRIFVGEETIILPGISEGAHGGVPSLGNVTPRLFVDLYESATEGRGEEAKRLEEIVFDLNNVLNRCSDSWLAPLIGRKTALKIMEICSSRVTAPSSPLPDEIVKKIEDKLREKNFI